MPRINNVMTESELALYNTIKETGEVVPDAYLSIFISNMPQIVAEALADHIEDILTRELGTEVIVDV